MSEIIDEKKGLREFILKGRVSRRDVLITTFLLVLLVLLLYHMKMTGFEMGTMFDALFIGSTFAG